jgi:hypothetical protein
VVTTVSRGPVLRLGVPPLLLKYRPRLAPLLLAHPFEFCISVALILLGAQSVSRAAEISAAMTNSVARTAVYFWQLGLIAGGLVIIFSLITSRRARLTSEASKARNRGWESFGLILTGTSCYVYSVVVAAMSGWGAAYTVGMIGAVGTACFLRTAALHQQDKSTLSHLRAVNGHDETDSVKN